MNRPSRVALAGTAVVLLWAGFAYDVSRPPDADRYHRVLLQAAESAHDATQSAALVGRLQLDGKVTGPYAMAAFDDATKGLSGAQKKFAAEGPPDDTSATRRDQLMPLLDTAVTALGDTAQAGSDSDLRDGVARLDNVAQHLDDFVEQLR